VIRPAIYLDHNSTTPLDPRVAEAMAQCRAAGLMNPASQHEFGRRARRALEEAREGIGQLLGARTSGLDADRVLFTSGGTESNNLAIFGLARASGSRPRVVVSAIEHPSAIGPCEELVRRGAELQRLRVTPTGAADLEHLEALLRDGAGLAVLMLANNETGVIQPVREAAELCRRHGAILHTDAVQVAGKLPVGFASLGATSLAASAHKFHGPRGIGVLVIRNDAALVPLHHGGFQQKGLRPGTEPVELAVGMHEALRIWHAEQEARLARLTALRDRLESLLAAGAPKIVVNGQSSARLPHTSNVSFPGADRQTMLLALDREGVACSTGSACASGSSEPSPVLLAMGLPQETVESSLRISLGATTTLEEIDEAAARMLAVYRRLR
jgi:cysteine desulfurase